MSVIKPCVLFDVSRFPKPELTSPPLAHLMSDSALQPVVEFVATNYQVHFEHIKQA
jgi:hypothetical protein